MRFRLMFISLIAFMAFSFVVLSSNSYCQEKDTTVEAKITKGGNGLDKNVKIAEPKNDPKSEYKEREKSRTSTITVIVENYTSWYVKVYDDGNYQGTVSPYGKGYFSDYGDIINLYAKAEFDNGTYNFWGPKYIRNDDAYTFTWKLSY